MRKIEIYDTTLRDGGQSDDISWSVADKLLIVKRLDGFGVAYIEGGWPGANPVDTEFFKQAKTLKLKNAKLAAFGSTHRATSEVDEDGGIRNLLAANTPVITIFGKTWDFHVKEALKISNERNLEIIFDTVRYLKSKGKEVFFDGEHFFDGYKANPEYALKCLEAAVKAGADCLVLCDTNGGTLSHEVALITKIVVDKFKIRVGIHAHNDSECAVANSLAAVASGAVQVQGTINGLGERCGNANLVSVIPDLQIKMKCQCVSDGQLKELKDVSRFVYTTANLIPFKRQPYVGNSAFAHKGGIHVSAILRHSETYEHVRPESVGNSQRIITSDQGGRSNVLRKMAEFGIKVDFKDPIIDQIANDIKNLENLGFVFEGAEASLELLIWDRMKKYDKKPFVLRDFSIFVYKDNNKIFDIGELLKDGDDKKKSLEALSRATVDIETSAGAESSTSKGNGPVNALANALSKALEIPYPAIKKMKLIDYKVRVIDTGNGTDANVMVVTEYQSNGSKWVTVGADENVVVASLMALVSGIEYFLLKVSKEQKMKKAKKSKKSTYAKASVDK